MTVVPTFVITFNTSDYPEKYVVREHTVMIGQIRITAQPVCVVDTLEMARWHVERRGGFARVPRCAKDDAVVVESWWPLEYHDLVVAALELECSKKIKRLPE